uniref:Uncharacterized protein n=1 Tax=Glossina palpalis gambiensis TaxID=67801 RepID=A0A1B0AXF5_9MUSC
AAVCSTEQYTTLLTLRKEVLFIRDLEKFLRLGHSNKAKLHKSLHVSSSYKNYNDFCIVYRYIKWNSNNNNNIFLLLLHK